jgi:hypothetical protein
MSLVPFLGIAEKLLEKVIPDPVKAAEAKLELAKLNQTGELAFLDADMKLALGQMAINQEEAKSESLFKSGWRPFVGWACGIGFVWATLVRPIIEFAFAAAGHPLVGLPVVQTDLLVTMLGGLLGLGGMRSYEKKNKVHNT